MVDLSDGSPRWNSFYYGVSLLATSWLPMVVVILHIGCSRELNIFRYCKSLPGLLGLGLTALVFPILPTVLYLLLLLSPRQSCKDRRAYKKLEQRAHEIKSICGSVEAPIQLGKPEISANISNENHCSPPVLPDDQRDPHPALERASLI